MKLKSIASLLIIAFVAAGAIAQEKLTLQEAVDQALEKNHDVRVARNERQAVHNSVNLGSAGLVPSLDFVATLSYRDDKEPESAGGEVSKRTQNDASLKASYTLFDGFSNINTFRSLRKSGRLGDLQARFSIENTILGVCRAFYEVANSQDQLMIAREALSISQDRYERAQYQAEYGQANAIDVLSAEVDLNNDSTSLLDARLALDEARRNLSLLLDRESSSDLAVDTSVAYMPSADVDRFKSDAFDGNAAYLISLTGLDQARLQRSIARASWFPRLDLQMTYGYNRSVGGFTLDYDDPTRTFTTYLSLNFNIFNGFQTKAANQNATLAVRNSELYLDQARLDLDRQIVNAHDSYTNSLSVLALQERNLRSAELNFQRTEELFRLGQATTTTFREAQLNLIRAKSNIAAAKYRAKINELELLRLTGRLLES